MPQATSIEVGETVDVRLHSAVIVTQDPMVVRIGGEDVTVPSGGPGVVDIEVVNPLNWPPLAGDVWKAGDGTKWFGVTVLVSGEPKVRLVPEDSATAQNPNTVKTTYRPLTLEYRTA